MTRTLRRLARTAVVLAGTAVLLVAAGGPASAAPGPDPDTQKLIDIIDRATGWLVGILVTIATFFATLGGVRRMTAGDDPGEIEKSKGAFKSAFFGYALAGLAPIIVGVAKKILGI